MKRIFINLLLLKIILADSNLKNYEERKLSRKRRYLVFPEGSSLQLVYCLTMPSLGMGRIFTIGSTAAMAWQLPHEPMIFSATKHKKIDSRISEGQKQPIYHKNNSNYYDQYPAYMPTKYNHEFYSTEIENKDSKYYDFNGYTQPKIEYNSYFPQDTQTAFHQYYVEPEYRHIYRRTRRDLYGKLQKLLNALSRDGRSCILKLICEVSKIASRKGTFMEEIIKVIFRIKTHEHLADEDEYDEAFNRSHNCRERYINCPDTLFG